MARLRIQKYVMQIKERRRSGERNKSRVPQTYRLLPPSNIYICFEYAVPFHDFIYFHLDLIRIVDSIVQDLDILQEKLLSYNSQIEDVKKLLNCHLAAVFELPHDHIPTTTTTAPCSSAIDSSSERKYENSYEKTNISSPVTPGGSRSKVALDIDNSQNKSCVYMEKEIQESVSSSISTHSSENIPSNTSFSLDVTSDEEDPTTSLISEVKDQGLDIANSSSDDEKCWEFSDDETDESVEPSEASEGDEGFRIYDTDSEDKYLEKLEDYKEYENYFFDSLPDQKPLCELVNREFLIMGFEEDFTSFCIMEKSVNLAEYWQIQEEIADFTKIRTHTFSRYDIWCWIFYLHLLRVQIYNFRK